MHEIIQEIIVKRPNDDWLHSMLDKLEKEYADVWEDRNRLIAELSKARTTIDRLRAGMD